MRKGDRTRQLIIARAATLFNTRGYFGSSLNDLLRETGLEKGGIYNHFATKEEIALAAFDYAVTLIGRRFVAVLRENERALDRLLAIVGVFRDLAAGKPLPGGCPVLNTAVEADDAQPALRERAQRAMTAWHQLIIMTVRRGVAHGELRADSDPQAIATIVTATLEGAIMLTRLYDDPAHLHRATDHLSAYLRSFAGQPAMEDSTA